MAITKTQRRHRLTELLSAHPVHSQAELVDLLRTEGVSVTQATVSRDLDELGAIKVRGPGGSILYAIPESPFSKRGGDDHLQKILAEWVVSIAASANLVVIRTPPGSAHVVGSALDRAGLDGVLGNVCGDDTIIVVTAEVTGGEELSARLAELAGHQAGSEASDEGVATSLSMNIRSGHS